MKKHILALGIATLSVLALYPMDFGVNLSGSVSMTDSFDDAGNSEPDTELSALLWIDSSAGTGNFAFLGGMVWDVDAEEISPSLKVLKWTGPFGAENKVKLSLGRIFSSDTSGLVGRTPMDGVRIEYRLPGSRLYAGTGYTGLLFRNDSEILITSNDVFHIADEEEIFAVPRALVNAGIELPGLIERHTVALELSAQFDLWDSFDGSGETLHTQYIGMKMEGPLAERLYYSLSAVLGAAEAGNGDTGISAAGKGSLFWFNPKVYSLRIRGSVSAATGAPGETLYLREGEPGSQFTPVVPRAYGQIIEAFVTNNMITEIQVSLKPVSCLLVSASVMPVIRLSDGPVNYSGSVNAGYSGTETGVVFSLAPTSDLSAGLSGGLFFPSADNFAAGSKDASWTVKAEVQVKL